MSLGGLVDKILVYQSCSHGFDPSYGTSFFSFLVLFFLTTPICIYAYLACKGLMLNPVMKQIFLLHYISAIAEYFTCSNCNYPLYDSCIR